MTGPPEDPPPPEDPLQLVRSLIDCLYAGLATDGVDSGWNEDSRRNYLAHFIGLEKKIADGERIEAGSISRSMDHRGIGGGASPRWSLGSQFFSLREMYRRAMG